MMRTITRVMLLAAILVSLRAQVAFGDCDLGEGEMIFIANIDSFSKFGNTYPKVYATNETSDPTDCDYLYLDHDPVFLKGRGTADIAASGEGTAIDAAADQWDDIDGELSVTTSTLPVYQWGIDPTDGQFEVHFIDSLVGGGFTAITMITYNTSTGEITDADIVLDDYSGTWFIDTNRCTPNRDTLDVEGIVLHEMGHALGIAHWGNTSAVYDKPTMHDGCVDGGTYSYEDPTLEQQTLESDDHAAYYFIYENGGVRDTRSVDKPVGVGGDFGIPSTFEVAQNVPNPFNPSTSVTVTLNRNSPLHADVYNAHGQRVRILIDGSEMDRGSHVLQWDGLADDGRPVASGQYVLTVRMATERQAIKMLLVR
ncbi:MAG: hypothetical protein HN712_15880 [Gemmatimonadetes bacterium]|jgi:hypothetical protein|nr:hypothetical protein [Gemmatimonadota bacterium]